MNIAGGMRESSIVVGNYFDKYGSKNPLVRWIMHRFEQTLMELIQKAQPLSIHEVGCGEGYWVQRWYRQGYQVRGCDFSTEVIALARANATGVGVPTKLFRVRSIYDLEMGEDSAELLVCCEVLEHLERPEEALEVLSRVAAKHVLLSVPREPLWRFLNILRCKYLGCLGNTPGHIQHWSRSEFLRTIDRYFEIVETRSPLPWTMVLCKIRR